MKMGMTQHQEPNVTLHDVLRSLDAASTEARIQLLPTFRQATSFVPAFLYALSSDTTLPLVEQVRDHLDHVFVFRRCEYRGKHGDPSARRLVKTVARNQLLALLRRSQLRAVHGSRTLAQSKPDFDLACVAGQRIMHKLRTAMRDVPSGEWNLALVLETAFLGLTTREQAQRHGFPTDLPDVEWAQIRNLLDNRRRLGRRALVKALRRLVRERRVHRIDARIFAEFCGCIWNPTGTEPQLVSQRRAA